MPDDEKKHDEAKHKEAQDANVSGETAQGPAVEGPAPPASKQIKGDPVDALLRAALKAHLDNAARSSLPMLQGIAAALAWEAKHPGAGMAETNEQMQRRLDYLAGLDEAPRDYFQQLAGWLILSITHQLAVGLPLLVVERPAEKPRIVIPGMTGPPGRNGGFKA